jgi:hypothetical protein
LVVNGTEQTSRDVRYWCAFGALADMRLIAADFR